MLATAPPAHAAGVDEAKQFFDAGRQAYEAGQYEVASTAFEEAYRRAPKPAIAFSMAQAYRRQYFVDRDPAKLKRAVELYQLYLREVPKGGRRNDAVQYVAELEPMLARLEEEQRRAGRGPIASPAVAASDATQLMVSSRTRGARAVIDGGEGAEAPVIREVEPGKHRIRVEAPGYFPEAVEGVAVASRLVVVEVNLRPRPARLAIQAPDGAEVSIDGRPAGHAPFARPLELPAGRHFVAVTQRGHHPFTREIKVERGQETKVAAALESTTQRTISWYFLGGAGLLLLGGGGAGAVAYLTDADAKDLLAQRDSAGLTEEERARYMDLRDKRDRWRDVSYGLLGGAAAVGTAGLLLYLVDSPRVEAPSGAAITPIAGPGDIGVSLSARF